MRRLYALYGILSPFPQRPLCVLGRGWGEGKMKCEGGGGRWGNAVPPPIVRCVLAVFLFFNYYFWPVEYLFSCREQFKLLCLSVIMLGIYRPEFARWNFILAKKKFLYKVFFDNNDRRNIKLKTRQIRGGHRNYVTWRNFWELNVEKRKT